MNLFDWTRSHPVSVLMACGAFLLFGAISYTELSLEELPDLQIPEIRVAAAFPGFPPREMEQLVTIPLENALSTVRDVKFMDSVSKGGTSSVTLRFDWGADLDQASMEVRESIDNLYPLLPQGVKKPVVYTSDLTHRPCATLALIPVPGQRIEDVYSTVQYGIKGDLQKLEEVSLVEIRGLRKPEIHVDLDLNSLETMNLTVEECSQAVSGYLINRSIGKIEETGLKRIVKMETGLTTSGDIAALKPFPGRNISLGDIASVRMESKEPSSLFLYKGQEGIGIHLYKSSSSGTLEAVKKIIHTLPSLKNDYRGQFEIDLIEESGTQIEESFRGLINALLWGLAAASAVLFLIYRQMLIPLVTSLSIPVTLVFVFFFLYLMNISLNTLSLMGMVVGIGLIADSSIVVLEELNTPGGRLQTVSPALITSALTTIVVFLPPLFVPGMTSVLFHDLIVTIILTISLSLPVSHFFTPACYILLSGREEEHRKAQRKSRKFRALLLPSLMHRRISFAAFLLILAGTGFLAWSLPLEIIPTGKVGKGIMSLTLPRDNSFESVKSEALKISGNLRNEGITDKIYLESGYDEENLKGRSEPHRSLHNINIHINFPPDSDTDRIIPTLDSIGSFIREESLFESLLRGKKGKITGILGQDREKLYSLSLPVGFQNEREEDLPVLRFVPRKENLQASGLTGINLLKTLTSHMTGQRAGEILLSGEREKVPVIFRSSALYRKGESDLLRTGLKQEEGYIRLEQLGTLQLSREHAELYRRNRQVYRPLRISSRDSISVLMESLAESLPQGISILDSKSGEGRQLVGLFLFALILMYLILGVQSGSARRALLLFCSLPLSLPGSFLLLKAFGQSLNLYSFIGLLILQGTIVNTGILLVSSYRDNRVSQVLASTAARLRPVAATTLTTVTALIPVFINAWRKGDPNLSMALTVMGGMILGTVLVMIFIPSLYLRRGSVHD